MAAGQNMSPAVCLAFEVCLSPGQAMHGSTGASPWPFEGHMLAGSLSK